MGTLETDKDQTNGNGQVDTPEQQDSEAVDEVQAQVRAAAAKTESATLAECIYYDEDCRRNAFGAGRDTLPPPPPTCRR